MPEMFDGKDDFGLILLSITRLEPPDEHFRAIQAVCRVLLELYKGTMMLASQSLGLAGQVLNRSIFETSISGIILAKKPDLLEKFRRPGKYTHLRTLHFAKSDVSEEAGRRRVALHERHKKELEALYKEFGEESWHGLKTTEAIEAAGFEKSLYGRYYRSASAIAHGQAHAMVRVLPSGECVFEQTSYSKMNSQFSSYIMGSLIVWHFIEQLDSIMSLGLAERIAVCFKAVDLWKSRHMEFANVAMAAYDAQENSKV
jgi:hypothetical protein